MLAQFVTLVGTNHGMDLGVPMMDQGWSFSKHGIRIGNDVWLGAHVTVLPGITIGDGAVIAAGAVVNRDVGKNEIWAGIPARKIRSRNESSVVQSSSINTACGGMR
ncbi:acyltransferase [Massilia sp. DWR3-1-1]|uniref:acyltransferase n=1 Tax=Massilia sp. DWR3-1-1 TaxID=2804559 RepID=UPI003CF6C4E0